MVETNSELEKQLIEVKVNFINPSDVKKSGVILGEGAFGKVYQGSYLDKPAAIKELTMNPEYTEDEAMKEIINEVKAFSIVEKIHEGIVKFYGVLISNNKISFVFEEIKGKDLTAVYKDLDKTRKLTIIENVCDIIGALHNQKLIHRDIKPNNIMIEESGKVRIIDFGTVKIAKNETTFTVNQKGTDMYMCHELSKIIEFEDDEDNDTCHFALTPKVDVWAVGCVISEIFSGYLPWMNVCKNPSQIRKQLKQKKPFPIPEKVTDEDIIKLIKVSTDHEVEQRCTIFELKDKIKAILS